MADTVNDSEAPPAQTEADMKTQVSELTTILDDYFANDGKLKSKYEQERPIKELCDLQMVKSLNPSEEVLVEAVKKCSALILKNDKVRAKPGQTRTVLILRDLPQDVSHAHIKTLLETKELADQLSAPVKEIRPELNNSWFVRFATEGDCLNAALWLNMNGKICGQKVKCRVKSVLQSSTYNPAGLSPQNTGYMDPHFSPGFDPHNFYGFPPSPNFLPNMYPPYGGNQYGGNNRQGGGRRKSNSNRRNSGRGRQGRGRQQYQRSPNMRGKRQQKIQSENVADQNIFYEGQYVLIGRPTFDALVKQCHNSNNDEPCIPEALAAYPQLCCETPKMSFDLQPLTQGNTISPMPLPIVQPSSKVNNMPELSLGDTGEEIEQPKEKTKTTSFSGQDKQNEDVEEQKEEEEITQQAQIEESAI